MSHHTSRIERIARARINAPRNRSNSPQSASCGGRPAVGSPSKTFVRADAIPVSVPFHIGEDADNARNTGSVSVSALVIWITLSLLDTPT